jgi:hypothetical protein
MDESSRFCCVASSTYFRFKGAEVNTMHWRAFEQNFSQQKQEKA